MEKISKKNSTALTIFLCWLAYTVAYLGRYSYSSSILLIEKFYNVSHAQAGTVTTMFFFAYGIGQVVHGILSKYYDKRLIVSLALIISSIINILVFIGVPFAIIKYLWLVNGICQSVLWPTLISVLSKNIPTEKIRTAMLAMSSTVALGTAIIYGLSSVFSLITNGFFYVFLIASILMILVAVVWFILYNKATDNSVIVESKQNEVIIQTEESGVVKPKKQVEKAVLFVVVILGLFAVVDNLVKDGLNTWTPSILKETFALPESLSIILSLVLPILGMGGTLFVTYLAKKIKSFISLAGLIFLMAFGVIGLIIIFLSPTFAGVNLMWIIPIILLGIVSLLMHAANSVITSMAPLYMRDKMDSGLLAGVLNGSCYVGSTISSYGLGVIADNSGWNAVFYLLFGLCLIPAIIAFVISVVNIIKSKKNKSIAN